MAKLVLPALAAEPLPARLEAEPLPVSRIEATHVTLAEGLGGHGEAYLIDLLVDGVPYLLELDEHHGISSITGGDEPEIGKRMPEVRPIRTVPGPDGLVLDLLVDGRAMRLALPIPDRVPASEPASGSAPSPRPDWAVALQHDLAKLGFDPGPIDGLIGRRTKAALARFGQAFGHRPSAEVGLSDARAVHEAALAAQARLAQADAEASPAGPEKGSRPTQSAEEGAPSTGEPQAETDEHPVPLAQDREESPEQHRAATAEERLHSPSEEHETTEQVPDDIGLAPHASPNRAASLNTAGSGPADFPGLENLAGERAPADPGIDLTLYLAEPFAAQAQRTVQALSEHPDDRLEILTDMVGALLARGRLAEASALAGDLERRHGTSPELALLQEAAHALSDGEVAADAALLSLPQPMGALWQAIAGLHRGAEASALALAEQTQALATLPPALGHAVAMAGIGRLVEARRFVAAHELMRAVESWTAEPDVMDELAYWRARELQLESDDAAAAILYATLTDRKDPIGLKARYRLAELQLKTADTKAASTLADELELLATQWLAPDLEPDHDDLQAEALLHAGRTVEALEHIEQALARLDQTADVGREQATMLSDRALEILDRLIDGNLGTSEPLRLTLLSLAWRWATDDPAGRGRLARAAQALAEAGLNDEAQAMLERLVGHGDAVEQIETDLARAAVALASGEPGKAQNLLAGLAQAVAADPALQHRWLVLTSEALTAAGEPAKALQLLQSDKKLAQDASLEAARYAAAQAAGDWTWVADRFAARLSEDLASPSGGDSERIDILLGLAAALRNGGRYAELAKLAARWKPYFEGRPEAALFAGLVEPEPATMGGLVSSTQDLLRLSQSMGRKDEKP